MPTGNGKPKMGLVVNVDVAEECRSDKLDRRRKNTKGIGIIATTPNTVCSTPSSTISEAKSTEYEITEFRAPHDLRSPGMKATPINAVHQHGSSSQPLSIECAVTSNTAMPDFITQTDKYGNPSTPRTPDGTKVTSGHLHKRGGYNKSRNAGKGDESPAGDDARKDNKDSCEVLLESLRMMCCCIMLEDQPRVISSGKERERRKLNNSASTPKSQATMIHYNDRCATQIRLLPQPLPADIGKKCLVLDLDETLVHSSFRAVPGADFVIPVQIEDMSHFVYVAKRPGVDKFLLEMSKHYEIIVYTASLNKYADPLLDLLDSHRVIRTRLFRESCVYYEGNYVKDLSILDRDLRQAIIVDNSPSSYIFHPENAIDCTSFIDDPTDRELDQIGSFLTGIKDVRDVRSLSNFWRSWPNIDLQENGFRVKNEERQFER